MSPQLQSRLPIAAAGQGSTLHAMVRVRDYDARDREGCLAVFDSNVPRFFVPREREEFAAYLDALPGPYLVIDDGRGRIVACGGWAREPGTPAAALCWGMVAGDEHRRGLGRRLLAERLARIEADPAIDMVVLNTSHHTRGFYERFGFVIERIEPDGYAPGLHRCEMRLRFRHVPEPRSPEPRE